MTMSRPPVARRAYHFAELVRQLFDDHADSPELLKHAGDVLTGEAADRLQIWQHQERRIR